MKRIFRQGEPIKTLEPEMADRILQTMFQAVGREPNTIPLEMLMSYSSYRQERYDLQKTALTVILTLFLLLPLLFINPRIDVTKIDSDSPTPEYEINVQSVVPIGRVKASIGTYNFPVTEVSTHRYTVTPKTSGDMIVSVTLLNQQTGTASVTIRDVDAYPPVLVSTEQSPERVRFYLTDDYSGVDMMGINVIYEDGRSSEFSFDAETGCLSVPYPEVLSEIVVPDKFGNEFYIHLKNAD